jgi:hypothetical protein
MAIVSPTIDINLAFIIYKPLLQSVLTYASSAWDKSQIPDGWTQSHN